MVNATTPDVTYRGIHEWYEHAFRKLGWIVLAKQYGYHEKVKHYITSVHRLHSAMQKKLKTLHEQDRKNDLNIMLEHVSILKKFLSSM